MPKTYAELLRAARDEIREISPAETDALRQRGGIALIDVREASEWDQGHVPGATHVSKSYLEQEIEAAAPDRDAPVVLYCAGGVRSLFAAQTLAAMGYTDVASVKGGFQAWKSQGYEWTQPVRLTDEQKTRYSRHLLIPEVGSAGPGEAARVEGAADRRRRPRRPGIALPGRRGRRARSGSSTSTSSTSRTSSARSSTRPTASARRRSTPPARRSTRSTRT